MKKAILGGLLTAFVSTSLIADIVYVTSLPQGCTVTTDPGSGCGTINLDGTYTEVGFTLANTGIKGSALGRPVTANSSRYYQSSTALSNTNAGVDIKPVLAVPGGIYQIDYNWNANAGNSSQDILMSASCTGGALSFTDTTLFRRSNGIATSWKFMGFLTNDVDSSTPTISFRYASGLVQASTGNRLLFDCWRFTLYEPCLTVPVVTVVGPLSSNVNDVVVAGVSASATEIKVYQNSGSGMVLIGSKTSGVTEGNNTVTVSGLVKDAQVAATQTVGGQEGCVPTSGTLVGGGANPSLRMAFSIRYDPALTGPAGNPGTSGGNVYYLGASSILSGSAPEQGAVLLPTNEWQTVTFARNIDPSVRWIGTGPATLEGDFGPLDGFALACEGDPGPFDIYIDDIANGTNGILQNFEGATNNQVNYGFVRPAISGTTSGNILAAPDSSVVTTNTAFSGTQCLRVRWQFVDGATTRWLRLVTSGAAPVANPQIDLNEPLSVRILVLPVGVAPPPPPPAAPVLAFSYASGMLTLTWEDASAVLQEATALTGLPTDWSDVSGAVTGHQVSVSGIMKFYRLKR